MWELVIDFSNMQIRIIIIFSILFAFNSCREKIDFDYPEFDQVVTMNSLLAADSAFQLHLSTTNKLSDNPLPVIENAEIQLFINDNFEQILNYDSNGVYTADVIIVQGNKYKCEYIDSENQKYVAESKVPDFTFFENLTYYKNGWIDTDGFACPTIEFSIINDTTKRKYYQVWAKGFYGDPDQTLSSFQNYGNDPIAFFNNIDEINPLIKKRIDLVVRSRSRSIYDGISSTYAFIIELRTVTEDYYNYIESIELYEQGRFPEFDVSNASPHNLYSNVENGYGIFAAYAATRTDTLY